MSSARFLWWLVLPGVLGAQPAVVPSAPWVQEALERALAASGEISDPFHRTQALAQIAEAQAAAGDPAPARETLKTAAVVASGIREEVLKGYARRDIALAYLETDAPEEAEAVAETIRDPRLRDTTLASAAASRRNARDIAGALATARRIRSSSVQGHALRFIVILQVTDQDFAGALDTARSIQGSSLNALAMSDVAAAMARAGRIDEAAQLAMRIRDPLSRAQALEEVATAQAIAGNPAGALATLDQVTDPLQRAEGLARVAASGPSGAPRPESRQTFEKAIATVVATRTDPARRGEVLTEIARAQIAAADIAGARATLRRVFDELRRVKDRDDQLTLYSRVAPLQARAGDYAGAFSSAMRADDNSLRPLLVRDIATYQADHGDAAGAVSLASTLEDREAAAAALFGILRSQVQSHDVQAIPGTLAATLKTVRAIGSPELRAGALGSLAAARIVAGDVDAAREVFTEAMNTAASLDRGMDQAAVYARIADALADRRALLE